MTDKSQPPGDGVRIASVQIENVKSVKAFHVSPGATGLTIVGGKNAQGKTSVLDAIAWALGGAKKQPTNAQRNGAMSPPSISITLSNGIRAERKGKNSSLTVIDPSGQRGGQALLDAFVSEFALDLPRFLNAPAREKAQILLRILGIGDELVKLDQDEKRLYNERHTIGQIKTAKEKHAAELPEYSDAPAEPLSISDLLQRQQAVLTRNGENQRKREQKDRIAEGLAKCRANIEETERMLADLREAEARYVSDLETAEREAADLVDESTAELERQIAEFEAINHQIAANQQKNAARDEAEQYAAQYEAKSMEIEAVRKSRLALLEGAPLPLDGLTVEDGDLRYKGQAWDGMSGAEQLRVAVAIVRALKPECQFVLMDKLEQMDLDTLREFGAWLEAEGLQVIATRVSTGDECAIIIEDGLPAGKTYADVITGVSASAAAPAISEEF
jgi:hypothetical protein